MKRVPKFNRLWIRISLVFLFVLALLAAIPPTFFALNGFRSPIYELPQIAAESSREELLDYVDSQQTLIMRTISIMLTIGAVIGVMIGVGTSHSLTRPLDRLRRAAERIENNDLSVRVEDKSTVTYEIQELTRSFNSMAQKLEKGEELRKTLLSDVAHELRNPLQVIEGNIEAMLDGIFERDDEQMERLLNQTHLLIALVDDLHELAKAEAKQLELHLSQVDLVKLVTDVTQSFVPNATHKNIKLEHELPENPICIDADKERLRQVMLNLLSNAVRYTPEGGEILISLEEVESTVQIAVRDSGVGIETESLPYVFDRFYRTDKARSRAKGGTGLGLAIVKAMVEMHQGTISVSSDGVGQGSKFMITLPVY